MALGKYVFPCMHTYTYTCMDTSIYKYAYTPWFKVSGALHHTPHDLVLVVRCEVKIFGASIEAEDNVGAWDIPGLFHEIAQQMHVVEILYIYIYIYIYTYIHTYICIYIHVCIMEVGAWDMPEAERPVLCFLGGGPLLSVKLPVE
jgi:hypothetical protein